jgi:hypothetical protein
LEGCFPLLVAILLSDVWLNPDEGCLERRQPYGKKLGPESRKLRFMIYRSLILVTTLVHSAKHTKIKRT